MERDAYTDELARLLDELDPECRAWAVGVIREFMLELRGDLMVREVLGSRYEPIDLSDWRPSTLPPGCATWAEYETRLQAAWRGSVGD